MSSIVITDEIRSKADEYYQGHEKCSEKSKFLLKEMGLPTGLLPLQDMIECGYIKETGFVWIKQKKKIEHKFEKIGKLVSYSDLITANIEPNRIRKLTGVKAKELLLWVTICDISLEIPITGKLKFQSTAGLFRQFPTSAFELEEETAAINAKEGLDQGPGLGLPQEAEEQEAEKKVGAGADGGVVAAAVEVKDV